MKGKTITCTEDELADGTNGGCIACGHKVCGGIEPDARMYKCEECGSYSVYGLEELLVMGKIELGEDEDE